MPQLRRRLRHAEVCQGRHAGQRGDWIGAGGEHALGRTLLHVGKDRADRAAEKVDMTAQVVLDGLTRAAEWNCPHFDPLADENALCGQLNGAAHAVGAVGVLAGRLFQEFKEFGRIVGREVLFDADDGRGDIRHADGDVILRGVGRLLHMWRHRQRGVPEATERIAIGAGFGHRGSAEHSAATGPVDHHDLLPKDGFDQLGKLTDDEVGAASGGRGNDHLDGTRRVLILRHRRSGKNDAGAQNGRAPRTPMTVVRSEVCHLASPWGRVAPSARGHIFC